MKTQTADILRRFGDAAAQAGLADAVFTRVPTPVGELHVITSPKGIVRIGFEDDDEDALLEEVASVLGPRIVRSDAYAEWARDAVDSCLAGSSPSTSVPVDLSLVASDFRREVLQRLRRVPRGRVVTYGDLARSTGHPNAARAVGSACATNPVPIVVPCHRVVPSSGGVGNYGGGPDLKVRLLRLEGALN